MRLRCAGCYSPAEACACSIRTLLQAIRRLGDRPLDSSRRWSPPRPRIPHRRQRPSCSCLRISRWICWCSARARNLGVAAHTPCFRALPKRLELPQRRSIDCGCQEGSRCGKGEDWQESQSPGYWCIGSMWKWCCRFVFTSRRPDGKYLEVGFGRDCQRWTIP